MKQLLVVCGPTATGKTSLALHLSKVFNGEIVSADSRQVYKGMNIGTGKDLPRNVKNQMSNVKSDGKKICFYEINGIKIWGYDLVDPKEEFSVAQYIKIARNIIDDIWKRGKLPILVGGTGLYIKGVVDGIPTATIPKNEKLRRSLKEKAPEELFEILAVSDPVKAASMNASDRKNPRRLVRAIEIAKFKLSGKSTTMIRPNEAERNISFIGLTAPKEILFERIEARVNRRIKSGLEGEIKDLISQGVSWTNHSMNTLGYREWKDYFRGKKSKNEVIQEWIKDEKNYAKRQITWFKKDKRINWFDVSEEKWQERVEEYIRKWYKVR